MMCLASKIDMPYIYIIITIIIFTIITPKFLMCVFIQTDPISSDYRWNQSKPYGIPYQRRNGKGISIVIGLISCSRYPPSKIAPFQLVYP